MTSRVNGIALEDYKRFEVKETGLAVPEAEPLYKEAISNGYHPDDFILDQHLVLYLLLYLLKGSKFKSVDRYKHTATVTGALWKPYGRWFDATNDKIVIPNHASLKFGTGDFTIEAWIRHSANAAVEWIITCSDYPADDEGWRFGIDTDNTYYFRDMKTVTPVDINTTSTQTEDAWEHLVVTRVGTTLATYLNGVVDGAGATSSADFDDTRETYVGYIEGVVDSWDGDIGEIRLYKGKGLSAAEVLHNYNVTRWRYQ